MTCQQSVVQTHEERFYPAAKFACVKSEVDTSKDPMAGIVHHLVDLL